MAEQKKVSIQNIIEPSVHFSNRERSKSGVCKNKLIMRQNYVQRSVQKLFFYDSLKMSN